MAGPLASHMAALGAAAEKAARHRRFRWCRLDNNFFDLPLWRVIATERGLPLTQVQAFVGRMESLANKSLPRGSVEDFDAAEFAAALDIAMESAGRLYAALEERGWIDQGMLSGFFERNPDKDDPTAPERKDRERTFKRVMRAIAAAARAGDIDDHVRLAREQALHALRDEGRGGIGDWSGLKKRMLALADFSTCHGCHNVTGVTVTPRADQTVIGSAVDNSQAVDNDSAAEPASEAGEADSDDPQAQARLWLERDGVKIVTQRLDEPRGLAATRVERWLTQRLRGDASALRTVIEGARASDAPPGRFLALIDDGIKRALANAAGPQLRLGPAPIAGTTRRTGT